MFPSVKAIHWVLIQLIEYSCLFAQDIRPFLNTFVSPEDAPFIAFVHSTPLPDNLQGREKKCSGTILDKNWVLTLASCVPIMYETQFNITVMANLKNYDSPTNETQVRQVAEVHIHPMYKPDVLAQADIALLYLQYPFEISETVQAVQLESSGWPWEDGHPARQACNVIGYGSIDYTKYDSELKIRKVEAFHADTCPCCRRQQWVQLVCLDPLEDVGLCPMDYGAPLICQERLVGINHQLVVRNNCTKAMFPSEICGDYTVTSYFMYICPFLSWIKDNVSGMPGSPASCDFASSTTAPLCIYLCMLLFLKCLQ